MFILFLRAIILYLLIFIVIRLMGKRQISELQPFDLVFTLLIADLASDPIADTSIPLVYGIIPILALFLLQQLAAWASLKNERIRKVLAGKPQVIISQGKVLEEVMRSSYYSLSDLMEQLRGKDIFDITDVSYAIIETDGSLSVLLKGDQHTPTIEDMNLKPHPERLPEMLVLDGKTHHKALKHCGCTESWLHEQLKALDYASPAEVFFASLSPDGTLHAQGYEKLGGRIASRKTNVRFGESNG